LEIPPGFPHSHSSATDVIDAICGRIVAGVKRIV
jgi:hypothetical protein